MAIDSSKQAVSTQPTAVNKLTPKSIAALKGAEEYFLARRKEAEERITEIDKLVYALEKEQRELHKLLDSTRF